jgi:spore germination cell wall hydrolase CwlJ-like protein
LLVCCLLATSCVPLARAENPDDAEARIRLSYDLQTILAEDPLALPGGQRAALAQAAPPFAMPSDDPRQTEAATECLAAAAYHEARSEGEEGQRAVAQVVLNRVRHHAFPSTICGVVYQRTSGGICQFSFTCDGSLRRRIEPQAWAAARRIAQEALDGSVYAPVGLATRFHASYVRPRWSMTLPRVTRVGAHSFYLERGADGRSAAFVRTSSGLERDAPPAS